MDLNAPPRNDFDKCGFMDIGATPDYHEDEDIPFMTTLVKNIDEFLALDGIIPPILQEPYTTTISILYNDMVNQTALMTEKDEDGKPIMFVPCYEAM